MADRYLHHVVLPAGEVGQVPRSAVGDEAMAWAARVFAPDHDGALGGFQAFARSRGRCALVGVHHCGLVAEIRIAAHARCGSRLWREAAPGPPPRNPWCLVTLAMDPCWKTTEVVELSRAIAWAWIEHRQGPS